MWILIGIGIVGSAFTFAHIMTRGLRDELNDYDPAPLVEITKIGKVKK